MISRSLYTTACFLFCVAALSANTPTISIHLSNEDIYFPDSRIQIAITIKNDSPDTVHFKLADNRVFNVDMEVRDENNRKVSFSQNLNLQRHVNQVYYRTITLKTGEELSFTENLTDYTAQLTPGIYTIQTLFYPELYTDANIPSIRSNIIQLSIRAGESNTTKAWEIANHLIQKTLQKEQLPPDQVITNMLEAQRQENWDRFFLYLNLAKLYRLIPERDRRFRLLSEAEQQKALIQYRQELITRGNILDRDLLLVPTEFEIIETRYSPTEGSVVALLYFHFDTYQERKQYEYFLEKRNGFWEVIAYQVVNLSNQAYSP